MKNLLNYLFAVPFCFIFSTAQSIPFEGHKIAMSGPSPYAITAGKAVAQAGGNVVDVAVAMGLTLSVTSPYYAALGGGGFALINVRDTKSVRVIDFRETAPKATHPRYFVLNNAKGKMSRNGGKAIGVPGFLAGLWDMHQKHGKLPWKLLFKLPVQLAEKGFQVSGEWARHTKSSKKNFNSHGLKHFFKQGSKKKEFNGYLPGETLKQPGLAKALKLIQKKGITPFYNGVIAKDMISSINQSGGEMTLDDLKSYRTRWLKPLTTKFNGYKVHLMPPPSSGGLVIKTALNLMERVELKKYKPYSVDELHLLGEVMSRSFRGRTLLGDPDFHKNPISFLSSKKYLSTLQKSINLKKTTKMSSLSENDYSKYESTETTHFSVLDAEGNAVALTVTLNGRYGSGVVSKKFGIAFNNEMDDFTTRPGEPNMFGLIQGSGNLVEPGKRPLSSMSPTLVEKLDRKGNDSGKIIMSLGSPGGPRIINAVLQVLYRSLINGFDIDKSIQAPRVHHQFLPNKLFVDADRFMPATLDGLRKRGHNISETWVAKVYGVRLKKDGTLEAAFDSRGEGGVGGF